MPKNTNHRLTLVLLAFLATIGAIPGVSAQIPEADFGKEQRIQMWLDDQDKNQDGKVSPDEAIRQMKANFSNLDRNQDGFIDRAELAQLVDRLAGNRNRSEGNSPPSGQRNQIDNRQNAGSRPVSDAVQLIESIPYADTDNRRQTLDLMLPKVHRVRLCRWSFSFMEEAGATETRSGAATDWNLLWPVAITPESRLATALVVSPNGQLKSTTARPLSAGYELTQNGTISMPIG